MGIKEMIKHSCNLSKMENKILLTCYKKIIDWHILVEFSNESHCSSISDFSAEKSLNEENMYWWANFK